MNPVFDLKVAHLYSKNLWLKSLIGGSKLSWAIKSYSYA